MRWRRSIGDGRTAGRRPTGAGDRAFAAGADIVELADQTPGAAAMPRASSRSWDRIGAIGMPLIAAVRGFALGGGCELAMTCDLIVAGDDARFGQPEIRIGVMPGRRRDAAAHTGDRHRTGHGADTHRPDDARGRGVRGGSRHDGRAGRRDVDGCPRARRHDRIDAAARGPCRQTFRACGGRARR